MCALRGRLSALGLLLQDVRIREGHLMHILFLVRYGIGLGSIAGKSKQVYGFVNIVGVFQLYYF